MKARHITDAGVEEIDAPADMVEKYLEQRVSEALIETDTPAMIRLRERIEARGDCVQPVTFERDDRGPEEWFVRRLSQIDIVEMSFAMSSMGFTMYEMRTFEAQLAFMQCLTYVGTCRSEKDKRRYFASIAEVRTWFDEPGMSDICMGLFGALTVINPAFSPKKVAAPSGTAPSSVL